MNLNFNTFSNNLNVLLLFNILVFFKNYKSKSKTIPVTGHGGPQVCETSTFLHFLDNRHRDGGEVASLTRRPLFLSQEDSRYSFLLESE
jgi:hypothetical protein